MASMEEIRAVRIEKIALLEKNKIDAYPARVEKTHNLIELADKFENLVKNDKSVTAVGRIMSLRGQGAILFIDLFDGTGKFQALLKEDENPTYFENSDVEGFSLFKETVDESDFIQVTGKVFETKRGEKTIAIENWKMLAKSLRPVPDEHFGLKDEDERYRRRYIDILLNSEVRETVKRRSIFWNTFRTFLLEKDYVEVQTPVLENTPGGAEARPFVTHHNALDIDVYLRISCGELWQKKLLVSGMPKTFEIGRIFRNEGISATHLQDYTQVEFYEAYSDFEKGMKMVKDLYTTVAEKTFGTTKFEIEGAEVDLSDEWEEYDYVKIIEDKFKINVLDASLDDLVKIIDGANIAREKDLNKERATDLVWKACRKDLTGPGFLINVPLFLEPLAKKTEDGRTVERFQVILGGTEVGKGFSELNNPIDQSERFEHQESLRAAGDDEAQMKDSEYIEAMEYGMPPAFGFGISERLFAILSGVSVREAQIFPLMRPKD